jgi:hypothetical protein
MRFDVVIEMENEEPVSMVITYVFTPVSSATD